MPKQKYYVVWAGLSPGIFTTWEECRAQVEGVNGARYKAFTSLEQAEQALLHGITSQHKEPKKPQALAPHQAPKPQEAAIAVDAACSGNPGPMEYRGVDLRTGQEIFHFGPKHGTNNIGEFLAIVHALALIKKSGRQLTIYSDSRNAMLWVKKRKCRTTLARTPRTEEVYALIARAENWLKSNDWSDIPIVKWETKLWGEVPADFGRK